MAVAVLGVGIGGDALAAAAKWVVLLRDVLGEVRCDHLLEVLGRVPIYKSVFCVVSSCVYLSSVAHAAGKSFVVVALQQGGVRVGGRGDGGDGDVGSIEGSRWELGSPGQTSSFSIARVRWLRIAIGCDTFDGTRGI